MTLEPEENEHTVHDRAAHAARAIVAELPNVGGPITIPARSLALIVLLEPKGRNIVSIARILGIGTAIASVWIDEAEELGYLERARHPRDHRITLVSLTAKGLRLRQRRRGSGG